VGYAERVERRDGDRDLGGGESVKDVYSGGVVSGTFFSGGTQVVFSGATVSGAVISGGAQVDNCNDDFE
jgi:autotransporter passenger strand-loop-strand repeat protein